VIIIKQPVQNPLFWPEPAPGGAQTTAKLTLSLSGTSALLCGPTAVTTIAGKLGIVVRAGETAGTTRIIASSGGITSDTITIATHVIEQPPVAVHRPISHAERSGMSAPYVVITPSGISVSRSVEKLVVYDVLGRVVVTLQEAARSKKARFASGVYFITIRETDTQEYRQCAIVR
jgi:hypothetical protein